MTLGRFSRLVLLAALAPALCFATRHKSCYTADQASKMLNKDVCVVAHVYDVVQLPDGTRFLDVCPPTIPDAKCRFTVVSLRQDRDEVGGLRKYQGKNVLIRGIVLPMHGRSGIILSRARQFYGGPPGFRPNPRLLGGFNADSDQPPVFDPNLRTHSRAYSRTDSRDQEARPGK